MKFVLRFDDITPGMAWSRFKAFESLSYELELPLLIGVVPNCLDPKLAVEPVSDTFWEKVREWRQRGWTIAQHGYTHRYATNKPGILAIGRKSEFAGLSYEDQFSKLEAGKDILVSQGVWQPVFMAPSHSFDAVTLDALAELGFTHLTDGYGVYPYRLGRLTAVPQLFGSPINFGFGVYTVCLHVNTMSEREIQKTISFVRANRRNFVPFDEAASTLAAIPGVSPGFRAITSTVLRVIRRLRQ